MYAMLPEDGRRSPERRLISVDLPAPLGPTTACRQLRESSMATPLTAINPPNRRDRSLALSKTSAIGIDADQTAAKASRNARKASGHEQHQQNDGCTKQ